MVLFISIYFFL